VLAERAVLPPFGVCGAGPGATNRFWIRRDGRVVQPSPLPGKVSAFPVREGDVLMMESSGGGGFGDPLERDPSLVIADLAEGYVTPAAAESIYGVVMMRGVVDTKATVARRAQLRAARHHVRLRAVPDGDEAPGRAVRIDEATARALGLVTGGVIELVNPRGAPLRAWVVGFLPGPGRRAEVAAAALRMLALTEGAEVEIRAIHSGILSP
jgi:N-methylhydantoinase B